MTESGTDTIFIPPLKSSSFVDEQLSLSAKEIRENLKNKPADLLKKNIQRLR